MKKIVLVVLNNFTNDIRVYKECKTLSENGYDPIVVALHEYKLKEFEDYNEIKVHRIKLATKRWAKIKFIQFIKYIEFATKFIKQYKNYEIIHCNDLNTLPIGVIIKFFFNKKTKIVYDAHEYETERNGLTNIEKFIYRLIEKFFIKYADAVITVSESIANEYKNLYKIEKPLIIYNTPNYTEIVKKDIFRNVFPIDKNQKIFLYQGGLAKGRGIEIILNTFIQIYNKKSIYNYLPVIVFLGNGCFSKEIQEYSKLYNNIFYHEAVEPKILLEYTASADFGLCIYENISKNHDYALPNKIFEYIVAEIPLIVSNLAEMRQFVENNKIGLVLKENNSKDLEFNIYKILEMNKDELMSNIKNTKKKYNWENQEKSILKIYNNL